MNHLQWIYSHMAGKRRVYAVLLILASLESSSPLLSVYIQKYLIDEVFIKKQFHMLLPVLMGLIAAMILADGLYSITMYKQTKFQAWLRTQLTLEFMRYVNQMSIQKLRNKQIGQLIQHVNGDLEHVTNLIAITIPANVRTVVEFLILIVLVGFHAPVVLLIALILSPAYIILGKSLSPKLKQRLKEKEEKRAEYVAHLVEGVSSSREVIAFNRRKWEVERLDRSFSSYFRNVMDEGKLLNFQLVVSDPLKWIVNLTVLGYGGYSVISGVLSPGAFVVIYQLAGRLFESIQKMFSIVVGISGSMSSLERFREAIHDFEEQGNVPVIAIETVSSLSFENVSFRYEDSNDEVLKEVTFDLPVGKKIAFIGSSGSGKSTIAQLFIRFLKPSHGNILVNDQPLDLLSKKDWANRVSVVFQEPFLFPDTILNNIKLGRTASNHEVKAACRLAYLDGTIRRLPEGYDTVLGERGITLSGGQRQRIAMARALLSQAEILILDEATSALDTVTERILMDNIDRHRAGKTTIVIAHRLSTIQNADKIFLLENGGIVEQGSHDQLMSHHSKYKQLVLAQEKEVTRQQPIEENNK